MCRVGWKRLGIFYSGFTSLCIRLVGVGALETKVFKLSLLLIRKKKQLKIYESKEFNCQCRTPCRTPC